MFIPGHAKKWAISDHMHCGFVYIEMCCGGQILVLLAVYTKDELVNMERYKLR